MTEPAALPSWHALQVRARIRFLANLGSAPLADVDEAEGVTAVITGVLDNTLNGVFRARLEPSRADRVIAATLARFQERHAPPSGGWTPAARPPTVQHAWRRPAASPSSRESCAAARSPTCTADPATGSQGRASPPRLARPGSRSGRASTRRARPGSRSSRSAGPMTWTVGSRWRGLCGPRRPRRATWPGAERSTRASGSIPAPLCGTGWRVPATGRWGCARRSTRSRTRSSSSTTSASPRPPAAAGSPPHFCTRRWGRHSGARRGAPLPAALQALQALGRVEEVRVRPRHPRERLPGGVEVPRPLGQRPLRVGQA
jgi:hypothetical protein